ncbi:MAG TPA: hypothetical protein VLT87_14225, partial [Thermoanaerobaculia bacterium]|nr:hypothetical protein [Thermoanaerobaculia bacterium]
SEGPARLVHDFFLGEFEEVRTLPQFTKLGNALFFVAEDLDLGPSVWRSDGTPGGTGRVPAAGAPEGDVDPKILGPLGPRMLWMTNAAGAPSSRVLVSAGRHGDGTVVATFTPFFNSYYDDSDGPVKVGQRFFFQDCTARECTFWSTDGTPAGTRPVRALASQFTKTNQQILGAFADRWLVFRSRRALYAYDAPRDRVLFLLSTDAQGLEGAWIYPVGDSLFLHIRHKSYYGQLWVSRLSAPRASQIFESTGLTVAGRRDDRLYFLTGSGQLWATDGRPGGTRRYPPGRPEPYTVLADRLGTLGPITFLSVPGYYSGGLWAADENRRELREIHHLCSGKEGCELTSMSPVTTVGDQAFLEINGSLWQSDGTPEGTKPNEVFGQTDPGTFRVLGGRLVLSATSREGEQQIWETDGTAAGTRALSDPAGGPFYGKGPPIPFAGALYTSAVRKPLGQQLWRVADGRATPITDLRHLASGVSPHRAIPVGDRVLLTGGGTQGWLSLAEDGSTEKLPGLSPFDCSSSDLCSRPNIPLGRRLLFSQGFKLWATDGTAAGTAAIPLERDDETLAPAALGSWGDRALVVDEKGGLWTSDGSSAHFFAQLQNPDLYWREKPIGPPLALGPLAFLFRVVPVDNELAALELWRTDGTAAGTLRLASLPFDKNLTPHPHPALVGGRLFFRFRGVLWVSDGSAGGTKPLANQLPGGTFALAAGTTTLYAAAGPEDGTQSHTLWALDSGTLKATRLATYRWISGGSGFPLGNVLGNTLLFRATDENSVTRRWVTEGTPQSTRTVPEPLASDDLYNKKIFTAGNRHWFSACDPEHGCELWSTDRLGEDTRLVQDLWPGPRGSSPVILAVTKDAIWFAATEPDAGRELWKIDL